MPTKKKNPDEEIKVKKPQKKGGEKKKTAEKKKTKKKPTKLQKSVADKIVEVVKNGGKLSLPQILRDEGASKTLQRTTKKLTDGKGFIDYLSEIVPPNLLAELQARQLGAREIRTITFPLAVKPEAIANALASMDIILLDLNTSALNYKHFALVAAPNHQVINAALKTVHELQGNLKPPDDGDEQKRQSALIVVEQLQLIMQGGQGVMPKLIKNAKQ